MQGYRAVHVVARVDQLPVEVQVRTAWQHQWAESFEKIADRLGRSIRYSSEVDIEDVLASLGLPSTVPESLRSAATKLTATAVKSSLEYSVRIAEAEAALAAGATAKQVEDTARRCNAAMQFLAELLNAIATSLPTSSVHGWREL
jgi:ppGpp synthetase/RelA/SpoT-type nucleotidyltranferase